MTVRTLGPTGPPRRMAAPERWARVLAWFAALLVVSLWCEIVGHLWCLWPTRRGSAARVRRSNRLVRFWGTTLFRLTTGWLRAGITIHGHVPPGRFIVVSNHQSTADIAILIAVLDTLNCKYVAKSELGWAMPAVSMAIARFGGALTSRRPNKRELLSLRRMAAELESWDGSAVLFPEGSRSRDGRVRPFRAGATRVVAESSRLPLLPVALDGTHPAADLAGFVRCMPGARVGLWIGAPVPPEAWEGRMAEALEECRTWVADRIDEGRASGLVPPPRDWSPGATRADGPPVEG